MSKRSVIDRMRALFDVLAREAESNPRLAGQIARILDGDEALTAAPERAGRRGRRNPGVVDPFLVLRERGEANLRVELAGLSDEQLKDIIAEHMLDSSKLAMKWKAKERLVDLILSSVASRSRKGDAFRAADLAVLVSDATYVNDWRAVLVGVEIVNRGRPDTITSITLKVGDDTFGCSSPPPGHVVPNAIRGLPRRLDQDDGVIGILYFGPSLDGGRNVPKATTGELTVRRASGAPARQVVNIRTGGARPNNESTPDAGESS